MSDQHEDHIDRRQNVPIKHVLQGGVNGLGKKPRANKTWVHLQTYLKDRCKVMM